MSQVESYKAKPFAFRCINSVRRTKDLKEVTVPIFQIERILIEVSGLGPWPWVKLYQNGEVVGDCNEKFFDHNFKKVK